MNKAPERSTELYNRALAVSPGGVHSPVRAFGQSGGNPLFIQSAQGSTLTDVDGNTYTDFCMAFGPLILGHNDPAVAAAAHAALDDGWSYGTAEPWSLELAELIRARIPWAEKIRFVNSGTEAVMSALRLARAATERNRVLKFAGCYHGHTDAMLIEAGSGLAGVAGSAGVTPGVADDTLVAPLDDFDQLHHAFDLYGHELAAAIIEPMPANHGLLPQSDEFLAELRLLSHRHGTRLIFDEVISGFRAGFGGCAERFAIEPDIVTWGKVIGGGFPVGAYAGSSDLMQHIAPEGDVYQAGTLSANPVAMRAGLATLRRLRDGSVYEHLERLGRLLEAGIAGITGINITRVDSAFWLWPGSDEEPPRSPSDIDAAVAERFPEFHSHLLDAGIYLPPSPWETCFLAASHQPDDITKLLTAVGSFKF
ncbi:MAG: glutamate-1-semialdehyde 2,1-aminomutase [Gammaproteobacteria bacterium]|nr:glutamate-1-semialdehyde 2,1-aminomutase [Gammaproteobacteria bacterium]MDP6617322.1 glutamate-1-semialdehyde 2,1-aminomutase [Gammaproteobacteria bacterium]MDP6694100.1 glutamate-1-semialdehyde 2,1-aminomutase [Gammaproteobacteria bacterium]MDP7041138.1 glutamate-1-semialdehyde 2,1-aminomutase [Gammaproteobacteria bacterium]